MLRLRSMRSARTVWSVAALMLAAGTAYAESCGSAAPTQQKSCSPLPGGGRVWCCITICVNRISTSSSSLLVEPLVESTKESPPGAGAPAVETEDSGVTDSAEPVELLVDVVLTPAPTTARARVRALDVETSDVLAESSDPGSDGKLTLTFSRRRLLPPFWLVVDLDETPFMAVAVKQPSRLLVVELPKRAVLREDRRTAASNSTTICRLDVAAIGSPLTVTAHGVSDAPTGVTVTLAPGRYLIRAISTDGREAATEQSLSSGTYSLALGSAGVSHTPGERR